MRVLRVFVMLLIGLVVTCAASALEAGEKERIRKPAEAKPAVETVPAAPSKEKPPPASPERILADRLKVDAAGLVAAALKEVPGVPLSYSLEEKGKGVVVKIAVVGRDEVDGDPCRVVRVDGITGKIVSVGGLQEELPIEQRTPIKKRGLWEGYEQLLRWRVVPWSELAGLITADTEKTEGARSLLVQFQGDKEGKVVLVRPAALDLDGPTMVNVDVFSEKGNTEVAVAFGCGREFAYHESKPLALKAGWNKDLVVDLGKAEFKSRATQWEYTTKLSKPGEIRAVYLVLIGSTASGATYVDNVRIVGEPVGPQQKPGYPVTRLKTVTREELLAMSGKIPIAGAMKKAGEAVKGSVVSARLVTRKGYVFFEVDVLPPGAQKITRVGIDAGTGARVSLGGLEGSAGGKGSLPRKVPPGQLRRGRGRSSLGKLMEERKGPKKKD
ncbi:PepSY domain-containing protein [Planctomycetota bacterium]